MMLKSAVAIAIPSPCRPPLKPLCLASKISTEQLRAQLDQLHSEAESTRAKANNARLRLLRLSEAAEKLRRQAAISIQTGKENDARELLFQKKKVMQALEKSKSRIELFDKLSTKLNESISVKEHQLIGNIAIDLEVSQEDASSPVRIVPTKNEASEDSDEEEDITSNDLNFPNNQDLQFNSEGQENSTMGNKQEDLQTSLSGMWNEDRMIHNLMGISSYEDFLEHLDRQLNRIEMELSTVLRVSKVVLDNEDKQNNLKVQQTMELLESICSIRKRILSIKLEKVDVR